MILLPLILAVPAIAQACPPLKDHGEALEMLHEQVLNAPDERTARALTPGFWEYWLDAPDETAQSYLDEGMARHSAFDFDGALSALDALVAYCPTYAEGYNQRAFTYFKMGNYPAALKDLDKAIELSPRHTGALAGKALTFIGMGRNAEAMLALREALAVNPWLSERHLLQQLEQDSEEL